MLGVRPESGVEQQSIGCAPNHVRAVISTTCCGNDGWDVTKAFDVRQNEISLVAEGNPIVSANPL